MIAEEDPDGDGIVTKEEFTKMLERKKWLRSLLLYFTFNFIKYWTNKCLSIIKCVSLCKVKCAFNNRVLNAHKKYVAFITVKDYIHQYTGYVIKVIIIWSPSPPQWSSYMTIIIITSVPHSPIYRMTRKTGLVFATSRLVCGGSCCSLCIQPQFL